MFVIRCRNEDGQIAHEQSNKIATPQEMLRNYQGQGTTALADPPDVSPRPVVRPTAWVCEAERRVVDRCCQIPQVGAERHGMAQVMVPPHELTEHR